MADNVPVTPGTGAIIATDDVAGAQYQRVKLDAGGDGVAVPLVAGQQAAAASLPVVIASDQSAIPVSLASVPSHAVTGSGNFASTVADGANITVGAKADAKSTATDTTAITAMSVWKQISASVQLFVFGAGTAAAAQRTTLASDDPAVATLGATSGAKVITDANGTIQQYLRGLVSQWIAGTLVIGTGANAIGKLAAGLAEIGKVNWRHISVAGATLTRPANTTAYAANDSISDNGTAGSVSALTSNALSDTNDDPFTLTEVLLDSTDTGIAGATVRVHIFNSDPTASTGVVGGDNAAYSNKKAGWVGSMSGIMRAFSDGSKGLLVPDEGFPKILKPASGSTNLWYQLQTLSAFTPSASSTTLIPTFRGFQGRT